MLYLKDKDWKKIIPIVIMGVCCIFMVGTIVNATAYTTLVSDDYSHGMGIGAFGVGALEYLRSSVNYAKKMYMTWQGTYFAMFIQALLSPINNFGLPQLRVVMIVNALLFFGGLILFVRTFLRKVVKGNTVVFMVICTTILFMMTAYEAYDEIFFWFSGATSYSFPLSFLLLASTCALKANDNQKKTYTVLAVVLGIAAMGGTLAVAGTGCYFMLVVTVYSIWRDGKFNRRNAAIFLMWLIGALINALAPGNFIRHGVIDSTGVHPVSALFDAIEVINTRCQWLFENTNITVCFIIVFICGIYLGKKFLINKKYCVMSLFALFTPIVTAFPVALGYSGQAFFSRCLFLYDFAIITTSLNFFGAAGALIASKMEMAECKKVMFLFGMFAIFACTMDSYGFDNVKVVEISEDIRNGSYGNQYEAVKAFYEKLESYEPGSDVRIPASQFPGYKSNYYNFSLSEDPTAYFNTVVASYYGFNSLALYTE